MEVRGIKNNKTSGHSEVEEIQENLIDEKKVISTGFLLAKIVKKLDKSFAPLISNTFYTCILVATISLYGASTILFDMGKTDLILTSCACLSIAFLALFRLCRITYFGHVLMDAMKECAYRLDRWKFEDKGIDPDDLQLLRQEIRYYSESPIKPFSAFTVSTNTLVGVFGTIITYLIVLLQFKVSEPHTNISERNNGTEANSQH